MHGLAVTTVEGIGSAPGRLHAVQQRLAAAHGSQCGFCTPGIVMSMYTLLRNKPLPEMEDIDTYFQGNLCRCTGYRPILEGLRSFTDSWAASSLGRQQGAGGCSREDCCMKGGSPAAEVPAVPEHYSPGQEPIFPPVLQLDSLGLDSQYLRFEGPRVEWHRPTSLHHLLALRLQHPGAKIVVGNTELGIEVARGHRDYPVYLCPGAVPELAAVKVTEAGLELGAATTLTALEVECDRLAAAEPAWRVRCVSQAYSPPLLPGCSCRSRRCCAGSPGSRSGTWRPSVATS
jgi:xanthine dehydrogenase/oxidase